MGVRVFAEATTQPTCLRLEYPTSNVDERIIYPSLDPVEQAGWPARTY